MIVHSPKIQLSKQYFTILTLLSTLTFQSVLAATATYNLGSLLPPNQLIQIVSDISDTGRSVGSVGDVNNDGVNDMFIGSPKADVRDRDGAGIVYILFGRKNERPIVDLDRWNNYQGYKILGANAGNGIGEIVKNAGDVNGDGFDDLLIGVRNLDGPLGSNSGVIYVVYGGQNHNNDIDLADFDTTKGFRIIGAKEQDRLGNMISSAGDVNGDNIDDIIIRTYSSSDERPNDEKVAYVIYGRRNGNRDIDLANFDRSRGFKISANNLGRNADLSVSNAGDVNKDGFGDVLVGVSNAFVPGRGSSGIVYVIYGRRNENNEVKFDDLSYNQGFRIVGANPRDDIGTSIASAGDVNSDGIDDIIIGAPDTQVLGRDDCGVAYVIYGRRNRGNDIDLANLTSNQGFRIIGATEGEKLGVFVSSAGDVNNDGVNDIMIGTDNVIGINPIMGYILFGRKNEYSEIDLANSMNSQIIQLRGPNRGAKLSHAAGYIGDVNDDGIADIMIGTNQEAVYIIFGKDCVRNSECSSPLLAPICYASKGCGCTEASHNFEDFMCIDVSVESDSNTSKVGIIVGVTVGAITIAMISGGIIWYRKKKRTQAIKKSNEKAAVTAAVYQIEDKATCIAPESNNVLSFEEGIEYAPKLDMNALPAEPLSLANMADEQRACYEARMKASASSIQSQKRNSPNSSTTSAK